MVEKRAAPARHALSRRLFLHALGVVFFIAFVSLRVQLDGLLGSHGIWPAAETMHRLLQVKLTAAPALFRFTGASDAALHWACDGGIALSVLLAAGLLPFPIMVCLWALYLSLSVVGGPFMSFQWDTLLLESAIAGALLCIDRPLCPLWRNRDEPPRLARWLALWLLFRLMLLSGLVKLTSGDPTWSSLRALDYHYFTQPLPTRLAWYAQQLSWLHKPSTLATFAVELGAPFLLFVPGRTRRTGALAIAFFQLVIFATGNYGFFNLLTIALCIPALDDAFLSRALPARLRNLTVGQEGTPSRNKRFAARLLLVLSALVIVPVSAAQFFARIDRRVAVPEALEAWADALEPFRSINSYGLFAVMTTERDEIQVEGSRDGKVWKVYPFRYKPGALDQAPRQVAPHQPRLDWQMWFAALGSYRQNGWYLAFLERLLEGEPSVLALLREDPFPGSPPKYLRSRFFRYRFSTFAERRAEGNWWEREELSPYMPTVMLEDGRLVAVELEK